MACASSPQCASSFSPLIEQNREALILAAGTLRSSGHQSRPDVCASPSPLSPFLGGRRGISSCPGPLVTDGLVSHCYDVQFGEDHLTATGPREPQQQAMDLVADSPMLASAHASVDLTVRKRSRLLSSASRLAAMRRSCSPNFKISAPSAGNEGGSTPNSFMSAAGVSQLPAKYPHPDMRSSKASDCSIGPRDLDLGCRPNAARKPLDTRSHPRLGVHDNFNFSGPGSCSETGLKDGQATGFPRGPLPLPCRYQDKGCNCNFY